MEQLASRLAPDPREFPLYTIQVTGLGKCYRIGDDATGVDSRGLHRMLERRVRRLFGLGSGRRGAAVTGRSASPAGVAQREPYFWALREVSFEVRQGEIFGLLGHNGAGKSALLKILAGITKPSTGRAIVRGNVGVMFEADPGFHPELTGRENVYLAGAVLGMSLAAIGRQFDAIVAMARIGDYLDTPIKRYSTGMRLRLGFAVAAHLDAAVMLFDEVLASGDREFHELCLTRMREMSKAGRTVLLVSHDTDALRSVCDRVLVLAHGRAIVCGPPDEVIERYRDDPTLTR